jgi:hypothetical protein
VEARLERKARGASGGNWYDAVWLAKFIEAKAIVARVAPHRLDEFTAAFDILRVAPDFRQRFLPGFFSEDQLERVRDTVRSIPIERLRTDEMEDFGRFIVRRWPEFTAMQTSLIDLVSDLAGEPVEPSYNFLSLYTRMGVCRPHMDSPSAKWTLDICIAQSEPWPIHFSQAVPWPERIEDLRQPDVEELRSDRELNFSAEVLTPGDAVLFSGTNQWHYRDALPPGSGRRYCDLLFLHYVPFGTAELIQPKNWARLFDVPELAQMAELDVVY